MRVAVSLLKKYINIEKIDIKKIAHHLTLAGIEVDNIENISPPFSNVIVGQIEKINFHPNSKKLRVLEVSDSKNIFQVISKDLSIETGKKVAFAKIGASLTIDGKKINIEKRKIQNIESFGRLVSEKEMQISKEDKTVFILPDDFEVGKDLSFLSDAVLEISLTPNLGRCMSIIGIARELAAILNKKINIKAFPTLEIKESKKPKFSVDIEENTTKRYSFITIENIKIEKSPFWLSHLLKLSNIKPINNIVDVLNFVMLELGQPMHAFDTDKIDGNKLKVCLLKKETFFKGLDLIDRNLEKETLVIEDEKKVIAIAGILGSENSSVKENTKNIFIESAIFDPIKIRKESNNLNLRTESSMRFEKEIDTKLAPLAIKRACFLIKQICPNCQIKDIFNIKKEKFLSKKTLSLRPDKVNKIIGINLNVNEIADLLKRLDFQIEQKEEFLKVTVPTYRNDIKYEIDLIEEVARIYGYNNIEKIKPLFKTSKTSHDTFYFFEKRLKEIFVSRHFQEIITTDLISIDLLEKIEEKIIGKNVAISTLYSKSKEHSILRPSFLSSFLEVVKQNMYHQNFDLQFFEIGKIHLKKNNTFFEQPTLAFIMTGKKYPHNWNIEDKNIDFYDMKGVIENLFLSLKIKNYHFTKSSLSSFHPKQNSSIFIEDKKIGSFGNLHPNILEKMDIKKQVFFAELNHLFLYKMKEKKIKFKPLAKYPSIKIDETIKIDKKDSFSIILKKIKNIKSDILEKTYLLDIYEPKENPLIKNITLRFIYRDKNKTLSFDQVKKEHEKIIKNYLLEKRI